MGIIDCYNYKLPPEVETGGEPEKDWLDYTQIILGIITFFIFLLKYS